MLRPPTIEIEDFRMSAAGDLKRAAEEAARLLGYKDLYSSQTEAIVGFASGKDTFISLPTGSGKSLCYFVLPALFDILRGTTSSIALIVSPLTVLMREQVEKLVGKGATAIYVGDLSDDVDHSRIHNGGYQFVFMSPEALLTNIEWREMIGSQQYQENLIAIVIDEAHCVKQWGDSFRTEFARISEIRSVVLNVNIMALTATATAASRKKICKRLGMVKPIIISESPNRTNIHLCVAPKNGDIECHFSPLLEELRQKRTKFRRTIIFCSTLDDCSCIYVYFKKTLGLESTEPIGAPDIVRFRLVDMFSSCTESKVKQAIQNAFSEVNGTLRLIICTIAFGMGLDIPDIREVYHWGPSHDIESYIQEVGRAGRDRKPAKAILYYKSSDFTCHTDKLMKEYCQNSSTCRRELLLVNFDDFNLDKLALEPFYCCDICDQELAIVKD